MSLAGNQPPPNFDRFLIGKVIVKSFENNRIQNKKTLSKTATEGLVESHTARPGELHERYWRDGGKVELCARQ